MDEVDKVLNVITDGTKNLELNTADLSQMCKNIY